MHNILYGRISALKSASFNIRWVLSITNTLLIEHYLKAIKNLFSFQCPIKRVIYIFSHVKQYLNMGVAWNKT